MNYLKLSHILYFIIIIISLNLINEIKSSKSIRNGSFCLIENINYENEYLTSSFDYDLMSTQQNDGFKKRRVYTSSIKSDAISFGQQLVWYLVAAPEKTNHNNQKHFYIMNPFFDLYLCATSNYQDRFHRRRMLNLDKQRDNFNNNDNNCVWELEKKYDNNYEIWNVKYNSPMYAASFLFKKIQSEKRNVYLWSNLPDSNQFLWNLQCN